MAFASGSQHGLSFVAETTYGSTPGTPTMKILRNTSVGLKVSKQTFASQEIREDRQIRDVRHGTKMVSGPVGFELSYGDFDTILESALFGTWTTNVLKVGTTLKGLTLERRFTDLTKFQAFTGCVPNNMSLNFAPNAMVTGTFDFVGKAMTPSGTSLGTPTAVADNPPFDAFTGAILEDGNAIASLTSVQLNLANGLTPAFVLGSAVSSQLMVGRANLTGTLTSFFESETLLNQFLNESESSLSITLEGAAGGDLLIEVPRIKYNDGDYAVTTGDEGILLTMPFQAMRDSSDATNLVITRTPA